MNLNQVLLIGRATRNPETKYLPSGSAVTSLSLAVNRSYKDKAGEWKEECSFIDATLWGKCSERAAGEIQKGVLVFINGRLKQESWERDGVKQSKVKVDVENFVVLPAANRADTSLAEGRRTGRGVAPPRGENPASDGLDFGPESIPQDSIPF